MNQTKGIIRFASVVGWVMLGLVLLLTHVSRSPATREAAVITIFVFCLGSAMIWLKVEQLSKGFSYRHCLSPRNASWAFLATPLVAAAVAIFAWLCPPVGWQQWLLVGVLAVVSAALGPTVFRKLDHGRYKRYRALGSFNSSSKLVHDYLGQRVLMGSAAGLGANAVVFPSDSGWIWVAVGCIGVWVLGVLKDTIKEPNPLRQHINKAAGA